MNIDSALEAIQAVDEGAAACVRERLRQLDVEGWTPEHDDEHPNGELAWAAWSYIWANFRYDASRRPLGWPWAPGEWKPSDDPIRNLEKAGALIAAEISRLKRAGFHDVEIGAGT